MKLLVSDFDGTFKSNTKNLNINIKYVNEFMEKGNKFVIATARDYKSIKTEIDFYEIKYDYLICNNGLITFDNKNNIINAKPLTNEDLLFICHYINNNEGFRNLKLYNLYSHTIEEKNILEVWTKFDSKLYANDCKKYIETVKPHIKCNQYDKALYIGNCSNKACGILNIKSLEDIDSNDIYTIGDDVNDVEMLEEFNGYKMLGSNKKLWFKGIKTTNQVHSLIKKINKKY